MEDDEETRSPASPRPVGRITVTVAAAPEKALTLALPIQQGRNNGGGREDCWSEAATAVLIEAWGERYLELSRGNLKQKHWKEVADVVSSSREDYGKAPKTDIQCKNRIDTVKKKYKLEKAKIASGGGPSKWPFYHRLDHLVGPTAKTSSPSHHKLPVGIPVHHKAHLKRMALPALPPPPPPAPGSGSSDASSSPAASTDSEGFPRKRARTAREMNVNSLSMMGAKPKPNPNISNPGGGGWGGAMKELTRAIVRFGEAYEQAESAKIQQVVEMEKQRMKFAKELELQRMQFFMKTQLEISQLKHGGAAGRRGGGGIVGNASNHHGNNNNNNNTNKNNHSDSSN